MDSLHNNPRAPFVSRNIVAGPSAWAARAFTRGMVWVVAVGGTALGVWFLAQGGRGAWIALAFAPVFAFVAVMATVFSRTSGERRITIDAERREVTFENLRIARGFLPTPPEPRYTCAFSDLRGVERCRSRHNEWLIIHTPRGRIFINEFWEDYNELRRAITALAPPSRIPLLRRHYVPTLGGAALLAAAAAVAFWAGWLW